jgi:hypothetical protein
VRALAGGGEPPALVGGEGELLATCHGIDLFLQHAPLFLHVVEFPLQSIVDRGGDHRDQERQRHGQHRWLPCRLGLAFPSSVFSRIHGRIMAMLFWKPRDSNT